MEATVNVLCIKDYEVKSMPPQVSPAMQKASAHAFYLSEAVVYPEREA